MGLKAVIPADGEDIVVDSLTINGVDNAALATDSTGLVYGVTGVSGDVMRLSGTGSGELDAVVYAGSLFVAVGASGAIYTSTDGLTNWTQRTSPTTSQLFSLAWNGSNLLVATGASGAIITSPDGITWTARTSGVAVSLTSVTWDGTNFICVGSSQTVLTSPDGTTWTSRTFGTTVAIRGVASTTTLAVAVCASGTIKTSTDHGVTWTLRTSGVATTLWKVAVNAGGTLWTAVGDSGVVLTSPDGTTWTARTSGAGTTTIENVTFGNSLWVYVGDGGLIGTSSDAITWTVQTSGTTNNLYGISYGGSTFVAVGNAAKLTSPTGTTWTAVSQLVWVASTPSGTGPLLARDGNKTINGIITFSNPGIISAARYYAQNNQDALAIMNAAGSNQFYSDIYVTTGDIVKWDVNSINAMSIGSTAAVTFGVAPVFGSILSAPALATNGSGVVAAASTTGTGSTLALSTNPTFAAFTNSSTMLTAGFSGFGVSTTTPAITNSLAEWETNGNTGTRLGIIAHGSATSNLLWVRNTGGTKASPSATPSGATFISVEALGYTTSLQTSSNGYWLMMADGLWDGSNAGVFHTWAGTPNGSTTRAEWMRLYRGNLVIGTTASGATANKTLCLTNGATSPSASVDLCHIYCLDISAGNAAFACYQEAAVSAAVATASTNKWPVIINGTTYYVLMTTVP